MRWFYDAPEIVVLPVFTILFVGASCGVVLLLRPWVRRHVQEATQWDRVLGYVVGTFGVFFGILLGLVAVSVYQNYTDTRAATLEEASRLGALYRASSTLPASSSTQLRAALRDYALTVINNDWPQQRAGELGTASTAVVDRIESTLATFNPKNGREQAQYQQLLSTFDSFVEARRARLDASTLALPPLFWLVLWVGATINVVLIACIDVKSARLHLLMAGLLALFIGLVMFVTADLDHPYQGSIAVGPAEFVQLLDQWKGK